MTDLHLTELAARMQLDARRCYQIYVSVRDHWEAGHSYAELMDVLVWQRRASVASEQAINMLEILNRRNLKR